MLNMLEQNNERIQRVPLKIVEKIIEKIRDDDIISCWLCFFELKNLNNAESIPRAYTGFKKANIEYIIKTIPASKVLRKFVCMGKSKKEIPRRKTNPSPKVNELLKKLFFIKILFIYCS